MRTPWANLLTPRTRRHVNRMTFDDTLHAAFETLTGRLRDEIARGLQDAARDVAASAHPPASAATAASSRALSSTAARGGLAT